ncbi:cation transporter [uncultured Cohaesibacter sp.]|uniref:cation transporter n=1 Tax=uncultured Cohaesibacter sp. TaxID=1002546 RepID=UPI0029C8EFB3|nr:cation transporter [uncultured Cohaesibacter sp.]
MSEALPKHSDASSCGCGSTDHHSHPEASNSCCGGQSTCSDHSHVQHAHKETDHCHSAGAACGCSGNPVFDGVDKRYKSILWTVIALNAGMFFVEMIAGHIAGSQALQADALDFLGDSLTYGISLAVIGMSLRVRSTAALIKGFSLLCMGLWIFGSTLYQAIYLTVPRAEVMGIISFMALAANVGSVILLSRYKDGDANVRSVWLCSRNDAIGNVAVMAASVCVYFTTSAIPDIAVALVMAGLFLRSAQLILRQSSIEFRQSHAKLV